VEVKYMSKKIVGIIVCTLLMSIFITTVGSINVKRNENEPVVNLLADDVPVWDVDYSWTYTGGFFIEENGIMLDIDFNEAYFGVTNVGTNAYDVVFGGDIDGALSVTDLSLDITTDTITGTLEVTKSTLAFSEITISMTGSVIMMGIPVPLPGTVDITISYVPDLGMIEFPIEVNSNWTVPPIDATIKIEITVLEIISETHYINQTAGDTYAECVGQENVEAGSMSYLAYNISYGAMHIYYAPSVGNIIKMFPVDNPIDFYLEMIATSYPTQNSPLKPQTPAGPSMGTVGHTYDYTTKTSDPDGDQIRYGWDWNGDLIPDEWTGLYDSDVEITTSHTWTEQGNYDVRVKARDGIGLEGVWSDPLPVNMPRSRSINRSFLQFLENHPNMFPLLQRIIQRLGL
jgi:hypothetical protein